MSPVYAALNKWKRRPFSYGDADCCQFVAFIVRELTGKDYAAEFNYSSQAQAELLIGRRGELVDLIISILGKPSAELNDGDPCVVRLPIVDQVCGIKLGEHVVCLTSHGMSRVPERYLLAGWSV
tara:strand:+ start:198 stop:569 length:372 start_codon:yes stop_codon:yes gene_type:complete